SIKLLSQISPSRETTIVYLSRAVPDGQAKPHSHPTQQFYPCHGSALIATSRSFAMHLSQRNSLPQHKRNSLPQ
ncbi:MAG: hypothetical protein PHE53_13965, partial [Thermoguttaceae bacterium]|nr:hypothetical protein [Thermoguttaceae bacterium]